MRAIGPPETRRELATLFTVFAFPLVVWFVMHEVGLSSLGSLAVLGVIGCVVAATLFCHPILGVYGLAAYVYAGIGGLLPYPLAQPVVAIVAVATFVRVLRGDRLRIIDAPFLWSIAIFFMLSMQSILVAQYPLESVLRLGQYMKVLLLLFLIVQLVRTPRDLRRLVYAVFFSGAGSILVGAFLYMTGNFSRIHFMGPVQIIRFTGLHMDPNYAAAYMCAAIPFGIFAVRHAGHKWLRIISVAGVLLLIVGLFSTFSRAAIFAFSVVTIGAVAREVRGARGALATVAVVAVGVMVAPRYYWDRLLSLSDIGATVQYDWSIHIRLEAIKTAWQFFIEHPITGIGVNNFADRATYRLLNRVVTHNSYLEMLVGGGIATLGMFFVVMWSGARHAVAGARYRWDHAPDWMRSLSFYSGLSLASTLISATFLSIHPRYLMWVPLAICLVVGNLLRQDLTRSED